MTFLTLGELRKFLAEHSALADDTILGLVPVDAEETPKGKLAFATRVSVAKAGSADTPDLLVLDYLPPGTVIDPIRKN